MYARAVSIGGNLTSVVDYRKAHIDSIVTRRNLSTQLEEAIRVFMLSRRVMINALIKTGCELGALDETYHRKLSSAGPTGPLTETGNSRSHLQALPGFDKPGIPCRGSQ